VHAFVDAIRWLTDGSHWSGFDGIPVRVWEHVYLSAVSMLMASLIALPAGLYIGHTRRFQLLGVTIANVGRAVPSFGILVIAYVIVLNVKPALAFGFTPTMVALVFLAIPPILTNTYVGIQQVDPDTVEAARGMGMSGWQILRSLEIPLATPLVMAGLRTSSVTVVATATLSALIGGGTLGRYIVDGIAQQDIPKTIAGSLLVAFLAILTEISLAGVERLVSPRMTSGRRNLSGRAPSPGALVATVGT
jgi:osmoprotectant transport system permease protein